MTKRKERTVRELYHVTQPIFEAEMTPVLEGNYRIQGPLEETDHTLKKTGSSRSEKRSGKCCATGNVSMKAETGTCNVCAAPCSSCGHFNQAGSCMEIKAENEFSDEVSRVNAASRCSSKDASVMPSYKRRECGDRKPTASQTSNLVSASSSHDSMSENAESKASLRMSDSNEEGMLQKDSLGRGDARDHHFSHGEDASCVSGANDACASVRDVGVDVDRKNVSCSAASVGSFIPEGIQKICRNQSDPDWYTGSQSERKVNCNNSKGASFLSEEYKPDHPIGSELLKSDPSEITLSKDIKGFEENFSSQHTAQHVQSSPAKLETITGAQCISAPKSEDDVPKLDNNKGTLVCTSSSEIPMKDNSCLEPGVLVDTKELPAKSMDYIEVNEQKEKSSSLFKVPNNRDPLLKSQPLDVSDGSDIVEDDVKVCDICGDAGREDLLAICSRCSDGAEHTYCMRVMMDKVPEGDWLCEVCQMKEEANQRKNKHETVLGAPKISCLSVKTEKSAGTFKSNISLKSDSQLPDTEPDKVAKVAPSPRLFPKRHPETLDLASTAKRQALESNAGSPKPSSPIKPKALSRESSFKNLDKGKLNTIHPMPPLGGSSSQDTTRFPALSVQNSSKIHPQLQSSRGALSKSSSFNTSNSKAKVKMVQEVPQKHKLGRHPSIGGSRKEGLVKTINKSSSFSMGSSHSNPIESKPKVHSPNVSCAEDSRGFKLGKERNIIEKKNSFKSDRLVSPASASNIISPRDDKKVSPRGEATTLPSSISKFRDSRAVQADFKSSSSSKSTAGRGDFKRQSSLVSRSSGYSSFNGNAAEQKSSQTIKKVEIAANLSATADGPSSNSDMVTQDSFPTSRECMGLDTKGEETSFNQSRQSVPAGGKSIRCHKCKEIGHASQFCPNGSIRVSVPEAATAKSSRDIMNRIYKLKDANEADLVTNFEICKKSGDQSDELFMSRAGLVSEVAPEDQLSNSLNRLNNSTSSDAAYDRQESFKNCTGESSTAVADVSYNALQPTKEVCTLKEVDINAIISLDGNRFRPSSCDLQTPVASSSIPSRGSPIPDLDYIWQGGFEVHRGGRHVDYDGIQAHLSTSASPKVLEVVDKLPHKVLLEEVSRSSTWPTQFQNCATEDNIALYFFAKDVESYGRSYETLVENMMKNDLALKGILNGIELLIFPSNKLCENSKRWNMFYYLWGVFRAKRVNLSKKIDGSLKIPSETNLNLVPLEVELSSPIVNATQNESSSGNIDEELHTSGRLMNRHEALPSTSVMQFPSSPGSGRIDLNAEEESFCDQNCLGLESSSPRHIADSDSSLMIPSSNVQSSVKIKGNSTSMGRMTDQIRYTIVDQEKVMDEDIVDANYVLENGPQKSDLVENNDGTWVVKGNHKRPYSVMAEMGPQTSGESSACTSQQARWKENTDIILVDEESEYKKKRVCSETYSNESSRGYNTKTERYSCQMLDRGSSLPLKEQVLEGANDCTILPDSLMTTERYFFPVESSPSKGIGMRGNSIPVQVISSDEEDQLESECPNLDLALGGEKKSSNKRVIPLFELLAKNNNDHGKCPEIVADKCEEDSLGSLSLSLAVPFSDKMVQMVKPVAKEEPERNHIDTSLLLFGGFSGT